jgi:hypothetical protein
MAPWASIEDVMSIASTIDPISKEIEDERTAVNDDDAEMSALLIVRFGRHYHFDGYRYDRLADAVAYAHIVRGRDQSVPAAPSMAKFETLEAPSAADRQLMLDLSIEFDGGCFTFEGFRYDRLSDAVNYARTHGSRHA